MELISLRSVGILIETGLDGGRGQSSVSTVLAEHAGSLGVHPQHLSTRLGGAWL